MKAEKEQKCNARRIKGITLIALVITIVVLLILAAVSITAVFGDNGLLKMAKDAGDKTNEAVGKEQEGMENVSGILGEYTNGGGKTTPTELVSGETIEKHIDINEEFEIAITGVAEETSVNFENSAEEVASLNNKKVKGLKAGLTTITATWNESNTATLTVFVYDPQTIGKPERTDDYGKKVVGYTDTEGNVNSGGYRLFYQDENYTYMISDNEIELTQAIDELYIAGGYENKTGADVSDIGKRLNSMLKDAYVNGESYTFFEAGNQTKNIKEVGWLTDPEKWRTYTNSEEGVLAIGGPTIELFVASYNTMPLQRYSTDRNWKKDNVKLTVDGYGYKDNMDIGYLDYRQRRRIYQLGTVSNDLMWAITSPGSFGSYTGLNRR